LPIAQAPATPIDEYWQQFVTLPRVLGVQPFAVGDDLPIEQPPAIPVDDYWAQPFTLRAIVGHQPPAFVDELPLVTGVIDEDQSWDFTQKSRDSFTYTIWAENEDFVTPGVVDEYHWNLHQAVPKAIVASYFPTAQDEIFQPPFGLTDDYLWTPFWIKPPLCQFDVWLFNDDRHTAPVIPVGDRIESRYFLSNVSTMMGNL